MTKSADGISRHVSLVSTPCHVACMLGLAQGLQWLPCTVVVFSKRLTGCGLPTGGYGIYPYATFLYGTHLPCSGPVTVSIERFSGLIPRPHIKTVTVFTHAAQRFVCLYPINWWCVCVCICSTTATTTEGAARWRTCASAPQGTTLPSYITGMPPRPTIASSTTGRW